MPEDVAHQLRDCLAEVETAIDFTHPAPSSAFGKELEVLLKARRRSAATSSAPAAAAAAQDNLRAAGSAAALGRASLKQAAGPLLIIQRQEVAAAAAGPAAWQGTTPSTAAAQPMRQEQQQAATQAAAADDRARCSVQPAPSPEAGAGMEAQLRAGSKTDDSWQLCPLTNVRYIGAGVICQMGDLCCICAFASSPLRFCKGC